MSEELWELDALAQAALVKRGEITALELVDAAIARIEKLEPAVHALASTDCETARKRAAGPLSGPLAGVPFLVKDVMAYPGHKLTFGSRVFKDNIATGGSPYTEALDGAGLVVLGKTTTSEFGLLGSTETRLAGITRNPWDPAKSAGGSSGGAAAAVASGMVPMAHASDSGGSIRGPASMCGVFGFKPGRDRCVHAGQVDPLGLLIDHCVSRSVRDSALLLSITERRDQTGPIGFVEGPLSQRLRIGVYTSTLLGRPADPEVLRALEATARLCQELGHEVVEAVPPPIDGAKLSDAFFTLAGAGMSELARMLEGMLKRPVGDQDLEPFTLALIAAFQALPQGASASAQEEVARGSEAMRQSMQRYDVTLCPTIPVVPWELGTLSPDLDRELLIRRTEVLAGYTAIHNMAGVPAMSVPLSWGESGLPIGSHFAAPRGQEARLLGLAYELESAAPWQNRWPPVTRSVRNRDCAAA